MMTLKGVLLCLEAVQKHNYSKTNLITFYKVNINHKILRRVVILVGGGYWLIKPRKSQMYFMIIRMLAMLMVRVRERVRNRSKISNLKSYQTLWKKGRMTNKTWKAIKNLKKQGRSQQRKNLIRWPNKRSENIKSSVCWALEHMPKSNLLSIKRPNAALR